MPNELPPDSNDATSVRTTAQLRSQAEMIRHRSPQQFGHLRQHHSRLKAALDVATHNYPTSRQLYAALDDAAMSSQTFGKMLPLLVEFEIIALHTTRNSANRYDIRAYDADTFERLGAVLEAMADKSVTQD